LEPDVESRLDVLDEAGFEKQRIDFGIRFNEVNVGDGLDEVGRASVLGCGLGEVVRGAVAEVFGLADVEDATLGVLHEVDAGRRGEVFRLLADRLRDGLSGRWFAGHGGPPARILGPYRVSASDSECAVDPPTGFQSQA